jgi:hypothetical protein
MPRTPQKARKSTGGTAPRRTAVAVHPPVPPGNVLVPTIQHRQVSLWVQPNQFCEFLTVYLGILLHLHQRWRFVDVRRMHTRCVF